MFQKNENFYRKIKTTSPTSKNININQYNRTINYKISNTNINNNITNLIYPFTPINKFNKKFYKESEGTSQNSSDIKFDYYPPSLKDQILSPEDDDLYYKSKISSSNNNNNNIYDDNYLLNYDININKNQETKKILILDLDETLVHSSFYPFNCEDENNVKSDIFFTILFNQKYYDVYVLLRPYFNEFLNKMSKIFDIYIFTASIKEYAEPLLIKLDKNNLIKKKLFRDDCTLSEDNKYIKDLNSLNQNLKNIILIDNNPNSYRYNKCNGIPIKTWHFEKNDRELIKIIPFLNFLSTVEDVREYIPKIIYNEEIDYNKIDEILNKFNLNENKRNNLNNIKKCDKKLINIIRKNNGNKKNKNKSKNYSHSKIRISYPQLYTNNKSIKDHIYDNNLMDNEYENNKIFASSINFNKYEERKNNNYTINENTNPKYYHSPGTINFREPSNIGDCPKSQIPNNNSILNQINININKMKKVEKNKYIRSKSTHNFNDLSENMNNKNGIINFNLVNNQTNIKNRSHSKNNQNKNNIIKNYKSYNNDKNKSYNNKSNDKSSLFFENNEYYLFTLNQNENYKNFYTNSIININNKSLEQKMSLSKRIIKSKNNGNKLPKNNNEIKSGLSSIKQQKENLFRYKNVKNMVENNKNEENDYNYNLNGNKIQNLKTKKSNNKKLISGRNSENAIKRNKNMDKYISLSKTSGFNENININYINNINKDINQLNNNNNNDYFIFKKTRCSTLNSHHMNNHPKLLKDNIEENKNNTMETNKRFYNNDNYIMNLKGISRKNKSLNNQKSNINYNIIKQKNNKSKKNSNREINLLNKFMKEFNNNSIKGKNSKENESREYKTQRQSRYITNNKFFNYNYDSLSIEKQVNKNEMFKKERNDKFDDENNCNSCYRKNKANRGNNNCLWKKTKNINYENNYMNFNNKNNIKENEIENYTNVKNVKYESFARHSDKNKSQKYSEIKDKTSILLNDNNYLMKLYYSYGNQNS